MSSVDHLGSALGLLANVAGADQPWVGWLHFISDLFIAGSCFAIPLVLLFFVRQRTDLKVSRRLLGVVMVFFFACGFVHLIEAGIHWWPVYQLSALAKILTAVIAAVGLVLLIRSLPKFLDLKSGDAYRRAIEERKRVEEEIKLLANRLTLATEAGGIGVWDYDIVNNVLVWDEDMYRLYGISSHRFSGAYEAWEEGLHPEDKEREAEKLQSAIRGEGVFDTEFRVVWPSDGSVHYIKANGSVLRDESGKATRMIGVNWDNTQRRNHEDQMRVAKEKAEAAAKTKSEFLANMSHEIRTPMNGIMGMTELLLGTELHKEQREYLGLISHSAESLLEVINDILDFSKIEAGKLHLDPHEFRLRDSIGDTLQTLGLRAAEKKLELAFTTAPDVPDELVGDLGRIRQVLVNLVGNSIKFTSKGEVVVEIQLESRTAKQAVLHFQVRDTGIGITPAKQSAIFESFTQAEGSTTRTHGGTGLGLTISQSLVEMMNGRIWVESEPGQGSVFHFTASFEVVAEQNAHPAALPESLKGLAVLIVDDNSTNRKILEHLLALWKMTPQAAAGGAEALDKMKAANEASKPFELVLLDMMMPELDGLEVASKICEQFSENAPRILVLSSAGQLITPDQAKKYGIARVLTKPVKQSDLLEAITRLFGTTERKPDAANEKQAPSHPSSGVTNSDSQSLNILLAEDGRVNQLVAIRMLEKIGHRTQLAVDGQAAVDQHDREEFDVILMDVQMPRLDGIEATRVIRERELSTGKHIPIIAMTANAMKGDREKCLDAGMDDYLSKPVRSMELESVLRKYTGIDRPQPQ